MSTAATARALAEYEELQAERIRRAVKAFTLEAMLTSEHAFGLTTATPVQRAVCRLIEGRPLGDLASDPDVLRAMGDVAHMVGVVPAEVYLLAGIRSGKSLLAAAIAYRASQTCDVSRLRAGEIPRVSIVAPRKDLANVTFKHLAETVLSHPALSGALLREPTGDAVLLRHPSGTPVEVKVVAGSKAGATLVARWSAGCIFDEAPRMVGEEDGVVNFDDARKAVLGRMLPGAQLVAIGSPWAPRGPMYEAVQNRWLSASPQLVVIKAPGPVMNPSWWTPERIEETRAKDEQTYRTDVLGEFADPETSLISSGEVERATRKGALTLPRDRACSYVAAMDPGTRGNAWTLVVVTRRRRESDAKMVWSVVLAKQWIGSRSSPLNPDNVLSECATIVKGYGLEYALTDQLAADFVKAMAQRHGLTVSDQTVTAPRKVEMFESLRMRIADDAIEIPDDPTFRADLLGIRKRVTQGGIAIDLPRTNDGRHADYAAALALALSRAVPDAVDAPKPMTPEERITAMRAADEKRWEEMMRRGDEAARQRRDGGWIEQLEEAAFGSL